MGVPSCTVSGPLVGGPRGCGPEASLAPGSLHEALCWVGAVGDETPVKCQALASGINQLAFK